ncbi:cytochrome bd-I oxidase subunit CydX [Phreatobacter sp. AB_2022a]|nr:cytochrome bd-I oxidase subunit CydX [Phreatobacter sp. AB_2022a]MCZ0738506.1 cytochrome bd-I oxidase subunit CydX [Phreatobacter sp. AB_2022a]
MWYFAWLLGLPLAAAFAVLNAMWYELMDDEARARAERASSGGGPVGRR